MTRELKLSHSSSRYFDTFIFEGDMSITSLITVKAELNAYTSRHVVKNLVLDFSGTTHIDSSGIRLIINLKKKIETFKRNLYILKPSEKVLSILEDTNMNKILTVINSIEDLERQILSGLYETYLPYTIKEGELRKIQCSCVVCGSREVIGYLFNLNSSDWRWIEDIPFPMSFDKESDKQIDYFGLSPIVCHECFMASIRITDFNICNNESIVIKSTLTDDSKNLLAKSIKKRKKMMELDITYGDNFFQNPRDKIAIYKAYELAEFCTRTVSVMKKDATPFDVGFLNYLAIQYAITNMKDIHINNCRTWFTQALHKPEELSTFELAVSYFVLIVANLNLGKKKEASELYSDYSTMIENLSSSVPSEGFTSPAFWYKQIEVIWEREIEEQSRVIKLNR